MPSAQTQHPRNGALPASCHRAQCTATLWRHSGTLAHARDVSLVTPASRIALEWVSSRTRRLSCASTKRVDLVLGEDDLVAARWTAAGTQSSAWGDVAATGRTVTFSGVNIFRFGTSGKVIEIWNHRDDLGLTEQLGASVFAGAVPSAADDRT